MRYRLKTPNTSAYSVWTRGGGGGLLTILGIYFSHITSLCKVVLLKDVKIHRLLLKDSANNPFKRKKYFNCRAWIVNLICVTCKNSSAGIIFCVEIISSDILNGVRN